MTGANPGKQIETLEDRIRDGERDLSHIDAAALLEFSDALSRSADHGDHRHLKLLRHCTRMAEHAGGLNDALTNRSRTEAIVDWIHDQYDRETQAETNRDYRVALRVFGKLVSDGSDEEVPDTIDWVSSKTPRNYDPSPNPAEMLELEDDVKTMINAATNTRDKALVGLQYEGGLRGGELYDLTVGDVTDSEHGYRLHVDGKTGERSFLLVTDFAIPYVQRWLFEDHPAPDDNDAPLWSKLDTPEQISYQRMLQCFKSTAARAGVEKPVTPTNFRKSNAYWLAKRRDANASQLESRQGRKPGSDAVGRYISQFGEDTDAQYARLQGKEVETGEPEDHAPVECPRCTRKTPHDKSTCMWCGQALDNEAVEEIRIEQREVRDAALRLAQANPELLDDVQRTHDLVTVFEDNPELFEDARAFADALDATDTDDGPTTS